MEKTGSVTVEIFTIPIRNYWTDRGRNQSVGDAGCAEYCPWIEQKVSTTFKEYGQK